MKLINEKEIFDTWAPIIESKTGINDASKTQWLSKYCHYHSLNESAGAYNSLAVVNGMGSVQPLGEGTVEVQDDFELLCFDFVSTPSTQGAFMKPTGLNENYNPKQQTDKYSKINSIVSDIICSQSGVCCIR